MTGSDPNPTSPISYGPNLFGEEVPISDFLAPGIERRARSRDLPPRSTWPTGMPPTTSEDVVGSQTALNKRDEYLEDDLRKAARIVYIATTPAAARLPASEPDYQEWARGEVDILRRILKGEGRNLGTSLDAARVEAIDITNLKRFRLGASPSVPPAATDRNEES